MAKKSSKAAHDRGAYDLTTRSGVQELFSTIVLDFYDQITSSLDKLGICSAERLQTEFTQFAARTVPEFMMLGYAFMGLAPTEEFKIDPDWNGDALGRHLKNCLAAELMEAPREMREMILSDQHYVQFAMTILTRELIETFAKAVFDAEENAKLFAPDPLDACLALVPKWTDMFVKPTDPKQ